jgi:hypothetical protein
MSPAHKRILIAVHLRFGALCGDDPAQFPLAHPLGGFQSSCAEEWRPLCFPPLIAGVAPCERPFNRRQPQWGQFCSDLQQRTAIMISPQSSVEEEKQTNNMDNDTRESLEKRAASLINPKSGIANDFINHFADVFLLIENFPLLLPEMVDDMLLWRAKSYREYFSNSNLPGKDAALKSYEELEPEFRRDFEVMIAKLNMMALDDIYYIKQHRGLNGQVNPRDVADFCRKATTQFKDLLDKIANVVNTGQPVANETAQSAVDRLLRQ